MSYGQNLPKIYSSTSTAQIDTVLVPAKAGYTIEVASIYIMVDSAMTVTFKSGVTSKRFEAYPTANGGLIVPASGGQSVFDTEKGESLTFSTSSSGNCFIALSYYYEVA